MNALTMNKTNRVNSFRALDELNVKTAKVEQPQPAPLVFNGEINRWYECRRNGQVERVYLVEVKKDKAIVKDSENDKHSRTLPLAKFIKFFG